MKVELHSHTNRYSSCATLSPEALLERLIVAGYGAVYITDHNIVWPDSELHELQMRFPAIRVFPGVELTLGSCHLQVGSRNSTCHST